MEVDPHQNNLHAGTEVIGHTDRFVLLRFPTSSGTIYHVVDKVQAFVWSMGHSQEQGLNRLKYIDLKYGQSDSVFSKNLDILVESDYHIKCTLNGRLAMKALFDKTNFDKVEYHVFEVEKPKREKKIKKRDKQKKQEEKPSIRKRVKRTETARRQSKEVPVTKEKRQARKKLRKRK